MLPLPDAVPSLQTNHKLHHIPLLTHRPPNESWIRAHYGISWLPEAHQQLSPYTRMRFENIPLIHTMMLCDPYDWLGPTDVLYAPVLRVQPLLANSLTTLFPLIPTCAGTHTTLTLTCMASCLSSHLAIPDQPRGALWNNDCFDASLTIVAFGCLLYIYNIYPKIIFISKNDKQQ